MKNVLFVLFSVLILAVLIAVPAAGETIEKAALSDKNSAAVQPDAVRTSEPSPSPTATPVIITPKPVPTEDPTPPPVTTLTIAAVGDIMCLYGQLTNAKQGGGYVFDQCFEQIAPIISGADLAVGNLESLVAESFPYTTANKYTEKTITPSDGSDPYTTTVRAGMPRLNAPESFLKAVVGCGFDAFATANNHAFDRKAQGIEETLAKLDEYGMYHTGSYALPEDNVPLVINRNGIRVGIVSYTDISNQKPASSEAFMLNRYNEEALTADIEAARQAGAEFVMVYIHWGNENTHKVSSRQKRMAQFIADAGADIILGSHSHCTQTFGSIETQRGFVPVIYSMGNFISSMGRTINTDSVVVSIILEKDYTQGTVVLKELGYIPTLCRTTDAGSFIILPTTSEYIKTSEYASSLEKSRQRTIDVLGENVAVPK